MPEMNYDHARAIGEKLRAVRQNRRISLRDLARKADISASMLSQIETGKAFPSVRSIYGIAAALGVPVDYFFPNVDSEVRAAADISEELSNTLTASEMREVRLERVADLPALNLPVYPMPSPAIVHADSRPTIELSGGVSWARLTGSAVADVELLEITYAPGASSGAHLSRHEGREFGLVLEGELALELGFESYALHTGDSIFFDSNTPHRLSNNGAEPMRAVWVVLSRV